MMNYIWAGMLVVGVVFSIYNNTAPEFTDSLMKSCTDAVKFIISLSGIMAVWSGLMKISEESGLITKLSKAIHPLITFIFPFEKKDETISMILMSFMANIFGAGNSATVFSLKAMELMDEENNYSECASNTMCMFIGLSMSMVQLVPISIIKIRSDLGSLSPESIIIPSILAGFLSMVASFAVCKFYERTPFNA